MKSLYSVAENIDSVAREGVAGETTTTSSQATRVGDVRKEAFQVSTHNLMKVQEPTT